MGVYIFLLIPSLKVLYVASISWLLWIETQQTSLSKYLCSRILSLYLVWGEFSPHISEVARLVSNLISSESSLSPSSSPALFVSCVVKVQHCLAIHCLVSCWEIISVCTPQLTIWLQSIGQTQHRIGHFVEFYPCIYYLSTSLLFIHLSI